MSRFLSRTAAQIRPYTPGEQPRDMRYIKLNTNECPYPPSPEVAAAVSGFDAAELRLYPDPSAKALREAAAAYYGLKPEQMFAGGGSDEVLAYAFMAFFDRGGKVYFPDITYGFYEVYAELFALDKRVIPLCDDFSVRVGDYLGLDGGIFLANPNAPTGICLTVAEIEEIVRENSDRLVVIDEAYIDFSNGKSCVGLIDKYDNLLVVQTFSKSRGLAGMRLGFGFGNPALIDGLERIKYSFNPYNIDRVSFATGIAALQSGGHMRETVGKITATRKRVSGELKRMGFLVLPSEANFLFAKSDAASGAELYEKLKQNGILVRHFDKDRIRDFVRITIGTDDEMDIFLRKLVELL